MPFTMLKTIFWLIFTALLLPFAATLDAAAMEKELPLWELGIGAAPLTMPSYRGSKNQAFFPVPMPYIEYRGDFLRIDREGIRGLLYDTDRFRLDFSGDGALPAATDEDGPRRGMPDLDSVLEFGPSVNFIFHESPDARLQLRVPVRAAMAFDFSSLSHAGWKAHPHISVDFRKAVRGWNTGASIGPLFADRKYHAFYYDVKDRYAEPEFREAYQSGGGYSGTSLMVTASRRFEHAWAGLFVRYDNLDGAAFVDSPLVKTRHAFMAGFGIAYIFKTSETKVPATRDDFY